MLPWEPRSARRQPRARRRIDLIVLEALEGRQLLANSALGYSLPDLSVTGAAGSVAAWGGSLSVTATLQNTGASSMIDPVALEPGSVSTADAPASLIDVYIARRPNSLAGALKIGALTAPTLAQNSFEDVSGTFTLPSRPAGFAGAGGRFYVVFQTNPGNTFLESEARNNLSPSVPVRVIGRSLPSLQAVGLSVPDTLNPGDAIVPTFSIANMGTAATQNQGKVQVALVASVDRQFTLGSSIVALYEIDNIPALADTPIKSYFRNGRVNARRASGGNLTNNNNVVTVNGSAVTLPTSPSTYYLGLVIDPYNKLAQLPQSGDRFQLIRTVGPNTSGLPAAGPITTGGGSSNSSFPTLVNGNSVGLT